MSKICHSTASYLQIKTSAQKTPSLYFKGWSLILFLMVLNTNHGDNLVREKKVHFEERLPIAKPQKGPCLEIKINVQMKFSCFLFGRKKREESGT